MHVSRTIRTELEVTGSAPPVGGSNGWRKRRGGRRVGRLFALRARRESLLSKLPTSLRQFWAESALPDEMVGAGGSPDPLPRRMAVRQRGEGEEEEKPPTPRSDAGTSPAGAG